MDRLIKYNCDGSEYTEEENDVDEFASDANCSVWEWIPTTTLPAYYKTVLVLDVDMMHLAQRTLNPEAWVAIETGTKLGNVTHWMELPKPPQI